MKKIIRICLIIFILLNLNYSYAEKNVFSSQSKIEISQNLKIKINNILEKFYKKLELKYSDKKIIIKILEKVNIKIENIILKKSDNKKIVNILNYLKENILEKIKKYNKLLTDGFSSLNNGEEKKLENSLDNLEKIDFLKAVSPEKYQKNLKFGIDVNWANYKKSIKSYNKIDTQNFAKKGFDHIRIRFGYNTTKEHLKKVIEDVIDSGMIPIIAFGTEKFEENPNNETMQEAIDKWKEISEYLKGENYKLSFDIIIEVGKKLNKKPEVLNEFYEKVVTKIRETGGNNVKRIILISPAKRSYPENLKLLKIPSKANGYLMAEWHFFAAGPNRCGPYMKWTTGTKQEKEFARQKIKTALDWSKKNKIPTWVGAWMPGNYNHTFSKGCNNDYSTKEQIEFSSFISNELNKNKIPFAINADTKFYDREKHIWLENRKEILDNLVKINKKY